MFLFGQSGCISVKILFFGKVVESGQSGFISTNVVVFGQSGCIRSKVVVFGQIVCIRAKEVVFGKDWWLLSGKSGRNRAKVVVLDQKLSYSGTSGCIRAKW